MSIRLCIDNNTPGRADKTRLADCLSGPTDRRVSLSAIGLPPAPPSPNSVSCFPAFLPPRTQSHAALAGVCRLGGDSPDGLTQTCLRCFGVFLWFANSLPVPWLIGRFLRRDRHGRLHRAIA